MSSNQAAYVRAYIGLGSNLSSPLHQVRQAIAELAQIAQSRLCAVSRLYSSVPLGPADQPDYVNAVAAIDTRLSPLALLDALQHIEGQHGRVRGPVQWGPRTLDLDLLLYGNQQIDEERLIVPHPGLFERGFVLYPLTDIASDLLLPDGRSLQSVCASVSGEGLLPLSDGTPG